MTKTSETHPAKHSVVGKNNNPDYRLWIAPEEGPSPSLPCADPLSRFIQHPHDQADGFYADEGEAGHE